MTTMRSFLTSLMCLLFIGFTKGQNLSLRKLTFKDKKNEMIAAYEYNGSNHYTVIKLRLYQNGSFNYSLNTFNRDVFSEGKWTQKNDTLMLFSNITSGNIPIKLDYNQDSSNLINGFKIGIVKNLVGHEMPDGLVAINSDTNKCAPSYGICDYDYKSIDSIKIIFENGLSSSWIRIDNKEYAQITPIVQTNFSISSYISFPIRRYKMLKTSLKPLD